MEGFDKRKKRNHLQDIKAMSSRDDILPEVRMPKQRKARDKQPRKKPEMRERAIEDQFLWWLNMQTGIVARKVESDPVYNKRWSCDGHADLIVFCLKWGMIFYVEVKTATGRQRKTQEKFEQWCNACATPYLIMRDMRSLQNVFKSEPRHT